MLAFSGSGLPLATYIHHPQIRAFALDFGGRGCFWPLQLPQPIQHPPEIERECSIPGVVGLQPAGQQN